MEELKILDQTSYDDTKAVFKELEVDMEERGLIANANMCYIIAEKLKHKVNIKQILQMYDFVTNVLEGLIPKIIIRVDKKDRVIWAKKMLKQCNKYNMSDEDIDFFAFCIVYSFYIYEMNEELGEMEQGIYGFTSLERIEKEYNHAKKEKLWKFDVVSYSDVTKDDYGYSIDNPIEVTSVGMEYAYLNALVTDEGKTIVYNRTCSLSGKDDIFIDEYEIYTKELLSKKKIATLYISGEAGENSQTAPKGFRFKVK